MTAVLAVVAASMAFAGSAGAAGVYDAWSSLTLTLDDVTYYDGGASAGSGWSVTYDNYYFGDPNFATFTSGDGSAAYDYTPDANSASMIVNDTVTWSTSVSGSATNGAADSDAPIRLDLFTYNDHLADDLVFWFSWEYEISATVSGDNALAGAAMDILDWFSFPDFLDVQELVEAELPGGLTTDSWSDSGTYSFLVAAEDYNLIQADIYSYGNAANAVPIPSAILLLGTGLAGIGAIRRRRTSR
jgi:hypothetical protein